MADMMMFPKTVDEFMEKYKIVDTDEVYTNGAELVPIFRMKQWFEHVDAVPVRHGHWIGVSQTKFEKMLFSQRAFKCSVCGNYLDFDGVNVGRGSANFCPNCGAKMDEVTEDA